MSNRSEWWEAFNGVCKDVLKGDCAMRDKGKSFILNNEQQYVVGQLSMDCISLPAGSKYELSWFNMPLPTKTGGAPDIVLQCVPHLLPDQKIVVFLLGNPSGPKDPNPSIVDFRMVVPAELKEKAFPREGDIPDTVVFINWDEYLS